MPSFNQARYIEESILSVLNQSYKEFQLIVIDGGSSDGTLELIKKYQQYIDVFITEPDLGQSDALNKGFNKADGDLYGWLNTDDVYERDAFKNTIKSLNAHPDKKIFFGDWNVIDQDGSVMRKEYAFDFNINHFKYEGFHLNSQSMFWLRDVHVRFGKFNLGLHGTMDYEFILRMGLNEGAASFQRVPALLGSFRRHENQKSQGIDERVLREQREISIEYGYEDKWILTGRLKRFVYRVRRAIWYLYRGGINYFLSRLLN